MLVSFLRHSRNLSSFFTFTNQSKNDKNKEIEKIKNQIFKTDEEIVEFLVADISTKKMHLISHQLGPVFLGTMGIFFAKKIFCPYQVPFFDYVLGASASFVTLKAFQAFILKRKITLEPELFGGEVVRIVQVLGFTTLLLAASTDYSHAFFEGSCLVISAITAFEIGNKILKHMEEEHRIVINSSEYFVKQCLRDKAQTLAQSVKD